MQSTGLGHKCATTGMSWDQACRRAGGRRAYNRMRQLRADYRLTQVVELLRQTGFGRGHQTQIATALGVSRSTICRDFQRLRRRAMFGLESDKFARGLALAAKHAREDAKAGREYEARRKAAKAAFPNEVATPEVDDRLTVPVVREEPPQPRFTPPIQVPAWLPAPASRSASWFPRPMSDSLRCRQQRRR